MALAVNRTGTIYKKCDLSAHHPASNKRCAAGTCQHSCAKPERCQHAWTLRYSVNGKQLEKSFHDVEKNGRTEYSSGRKLAQDFQLKLTVDKRSGEKVFADYTRSGSASFGEAAENYLARLPVGENSREHYTKVYRTHVRPVFADSTLTQVAKDRDAVLDLLTVSMGHLSITPRQQARMIIVGTLDEAVKAGKLKAHLLTEIELADNGSTKRRTDFIFPTYAQVQVVADGRARTETHSKRTLHGAGICVWLMRGCGLRIEEALAVHQEDFIEGGTVLRVSGQASRVGLVKLPLKHRKRGEYRDVPVPSWLRELIKDMPAGPLMPGYDGRPYQQYRTILKRFSTAAREAGIATGFTPHSLRHAYASAMLARAVQISELAHFLGHRDINVTHRTYGHLLPSAAKRAVAALDGEYAEWTGQNS